MAFPTEPLGTRIDLQVGGVWTDVTPDVYLADPITITRGRRDQGARTDPGSCTLTLKNADGKYSPRNPRSPYFGLIGRNTPVRVSVMHGAPYLSLDGGPANYASTPDDPTLDITGDIDVRAEVTINWQAAADNQVLLAKWTPAGDQRSWLMRVFNNRVIFHWSETGTEATAFFAQGILPNLPPRSVVRATLDVDNGAGGFVCRLYWGTSMAGPWNLIVEFATADFGPTSVFASTAPLTVGGNDATTTPNRVPFTGRGHRFEVRNGIDGLVVAAPDFTAQPVGTTSFADSAGRTWTMQGAAEVSNRQERFVGEISSWPPSWGPSGRMVRVPVQAAGILRRLRQGLSPLDSTLRRRIPSDPALLAYWPMEEGEGATQAYSPLPGVSPMSVKGLRFAADDSLAGSSALPTLATGSSLSGRVPRGNGGTWRVEFVYKLAQLPASVSTMFVVTVDGSAMRRVRVRTSTSAIRIEALNDDGAVIIGSDFSDPSALADFVGDWNRLLIYSVDVGADVELYASWQSITNPSGWFVATALTASPGTVSAVGTGTVPAAYDAMPIGHLAVFDTHLTDIFDQADQGFTGETTLNRLLRIATEEAFPLAQIDGDLTVDSERVGPQRPATTLDVITAAADVDGGVLYEARDRLGLVYRDRHTLYNQTPALVLDYAAGEVAPPLTPVDDDDAVRNDITVTREAGSSGRAVLEEGALSVLAPPDGVGRYDESVTLPLHEDAQTAQHAGWRLHLGTWDETRYPTVRVNLAHAPGLIPAVVGVDSGDRVQIVNPPEWLPPEPIDLIVQGYTERIGVRTWDIEYTCTPAGPWSIGVVEDPVLGHVDTDGSELAAPVSSSATSLAVVTTADAPGWSIDCADTPFPVRVGGEIMTVTDIADGGLDTFTRTVASGWGSTDDGQAWTVSGGLASAYSVSSGQGHISVSAVNSSRFCLLPMVSPVFDFALTVETDVLAAGGSHYPQLVARWADSSNYYSARLAFNTDQSVTLSLRRRVAGTESELASRDLHGLTHAAGRQFRVRFWGNGSLLRARAWLASEPEPEITWHLEAEDSDLTASGSLGVRSILSSANTNPLPVNVAWDDLIVYNPQVMTVTRAVNGITKAHAAGADVRLAHPAIAAL